MYTLGSVPSTQKEMEWAGAYESTYKCEKLSGVPFNGLTGFRGFLWLFFILRLFLNCLFLLLRSILQLLNDNLLLGNYRFLLLDNRIELLNLVLKCDHTLGLLI